MNVEMPAIDKNALIDASSIETFLVSEDVENLDKIKQIEKLISSFECIYLCIVQNSIQTVVIQRIVEFRSTQKTSYRYFTTKMSLRNSLL